MTKALLEYETIDSDQIDDVMAGKKVRAPKPSKSSNDKKMPPSGKAPTSSIKPQPATKSR
jgi:cell division protease FtsH